MSATLRALCIPNEIELLAVWCKNRLPKKIMQKKVVWAMLCSFKQGTFPLAAAV